MLSLKNIMRANATSCLFFGILFALQPRLVASFLGSPEPAPQLYILILGILLALNGLHLLWASMISPPPKTLILYFSIGDYLWVAATIGLMVSGLWITTTNGILVASFIAVMVGLFGVLQMKSTKLNQEH